MPSYAKYDALCHKHAKPPIKVRSTDKLMVETKYALISKRQPHFLDAICGSSTTRWKKGGSILWSPRSTC
jgi:hypothetical protein